MSRFTWRKAITIAVRESRASSGKFLFVALAVAVGVAALTGVRGYSRAFQNMLLSEARTLMAADMSVRIFGGATSEQVKAMEALGVDGVERTEIIETLSMMSSPTSPDPVLVSAKAVDPYVYPFYGEVRVQPEARLAALLDERTIAVSDDLPLRLRANVGDMVRIGGQEFRIGGIVTLEPDRMNGSLNVGPRILMSREGLERAGLIRLGSRAAHRYLFKLPVDGVTVAEVRRELVKTFPEGLVMDFRQTNPNIQRALDRSTIFLSLVSLIALIVGALGVAMAMHSHLRQKMDTIAIMKCIGARSSQVLKIYLAQTLLLGLGGGALGVVIGYGVQKAFPLLLARFFQAPKGINFDPVSAVQGIAVGVLTTLLFTLPPLLGIRRVRPGAIFRREMAEAKPAWGERWRRSRTSVLAAAVILAGLGGIAGWLAESPRVALWFVGGLSVSLLLLTGAAWLLLRGLKGFLRVTPLRLPATVRHGIANLYRPGNHAESVLVALGIGVTFTLTVYLLQHSVIEQVMGNAPPGIPNVFLINVTEPEIAGVQALLRKQPGVEGKVEIIPSVAARLISVDGEALEARRKIEGFERRFLRTRSISWAEPKPESVKLLSGKWWPTGSPEHFASLTEDAAKALQAKVGSRLEWDVNGRRVTASVVAIHRNEQVRMTANQEFVLNRAALSGVPQIFFGGIRVQPKLVAPLQRAMFEAYPTVTVINAADILAIVQDVVDQVASVVRFISVFAILAGAVILASSVAGTRFRRVREVVILKTLGARRNRLAMIFSIEFLILGVTAGLIGSLLASGFSSLLLTRLLEAEPRFDWLANGVTVVATALVANFAGWLASARILGQKPLEVLREE
ncbi:MAG: FtsX-like permease family protein [Bryobacteraceae bacterium]|nr:FtsX-like permease family protein [Bryobacteraceae bacterium]